MSEDARLAYSASEAAQMLGVSLRTVRNLIARGDLRAVRIGRRVVIPVRFLEDLLDRSTSAFSPARKQ